MGNKLIIVGEDFDFLNDLTTKDDLKKALEDNNAKIFEKVEKLMEISSEDYFPIRKNEPITNGDFLRCVAFLRKNRDNLSPYQMGMTIGLLEVVGEALIGYSDKCQENKKILTELKRLLLIQSDGGKLRHDGNDDSRKQFATEMLKQLK